MKEQDLALDDVISFRRLPSLPAVALELIELVQNPDLDVAELVETVLKDPALASKVLRTANSSFYAQARKVSTMNQAIVLLGLNDVQSLALSFSLVDGLRTARRGGFDHDAFWRRSLIAAVAARLIARRVEHHHVEEAFLGGPLCRLGVLALSSTIAERYDPLSSEAGGDYRRLRTLEEAALRFTHADAGERLATLWKLPAALAAALSHVDSPDLAPDEVRWFVRMVAVGDSAAEVLNGEDGDAMGVAKLRLTSNGGPFYANAGRRSQAGYLVTKPLKRRADGILPPHEILLMTARFRAPQTQNVRYLQSMPAGGRWIVDA